MILLVELLLFTSIHVLQHRKKKIKPFSKERCSTSCSEQFSLSRIVYLQEVSRSGKYVAGTKATPPCISIFD